MYTPEEQRTHRQALVAALRSGQYQQAIGVLMADNGRFCCLGVGCEISQLGKWTMTDDDSWFYVTQHNRELSKLPKEVREYYGFATAYGEYGNNAEAMLTRDNDERCMSFDQIADVIESEPSGLLTLEAAAWR